MTFRWRYLDANGAAVESPDPEFDREFDDQQEAESWFSDTWPDLREEGVDAVDLLDGETKVYGPMSLHEM